MTVDGGSVATTPLLTDGSIDAVAVPVAPAARGRRRAAARSRARPRPRRATASTWPRSPSGRGLTGAAGEIYVLQLPRPVGSSVTLPWAGLPPRIVLRRRRLRPARGPAPRRCRARPLVPRPAPGGHDARRRGPPGRLGGRHGRARRRRGLPARRLRAAHRVDREPRPRARPRRAASCSAATARAPAAAVAEAPHGRHRDVAGPGPGHHAVQHQDPRVARRPGQAPGHQGRARGRRSGAPRARRRRASAASSRSAPAPRRRRGSSPSPTRRRPRRWPARRRRRQGHHLRHGRPVDQAARGHGPDEDRHDRCRRRAGHRARRLRPRVSRTGSRPCCRSPRTTSVARPTGPATC